MVHLLYIKYKTLSSLECFIGKENAELHRNGFRFCSDFQKLSQHLLFYAQWMIQSSGSIINTRQVPNASKNWCWRVYETVSIGSLMNFNNAKR